MDVSFGRLSWRLLPLILFFLAVGCGGGSGGSGDGDDNPSSDTTAPFVVSRTPALNSVNVQTNSLVTATFNEDIAPATVNAGTFTLSHGGVPEAGVVTYSVANRTATFTSNMLLLNNTGYTATLTTDIEDLAGNSLENPVTWNFTTGSGGGGGIDNTPPLPPF